MAFANFFLDYWNGLEWPESFLPKSFLPVSPLLYSFKKSRHIETLLNSTGAGQAASAKRHAYHDDISGMTSAFPPDPIPPAG